MHVYAASILSSFDRMAHLEAAQDLESLASH